MALGFAADGRRRAVARQGVLEGDGTWSFLHQPAERHLLPAAGGRAGHHLPAQAGADEGDQGRRDRRRGPRLRRLACRSGSSTTRRRASVPVRLSRPTGSPRSASSYHFGVDGISRAADPAHHPARAHRDATRRSPRSRTGEKEYYVFLLLLQTGMLGVFMSLDFVLFYVFWEVMLVPMYFLIGVWGGPRKLYAAIKFFLYTLVGSVLMLVGILALYFYNSTGLAAVGLPGLGNAPTFDVPQLFTDRAADPVRPADVDLPGVLRRVRHQGADVPVPHLAARRPRRGADGRLGDPGRRPAEDGHLRLHPLLPAAAARRDALGGAVDGRRSRSSASSTARWWRWCRRT